MRKSKDREFYRDLLDNDQLLRYYSGRFAARNDVIVRHLAKFMPSEARVIDIAAGSSYIAERLLEDGRVVSYDWNDFNPRLQNLVKERVQDDRFKITPFDVDSDEYCLDEYNVMVGVSMEHLEKDLECVEKMPSGSLISICSPDLIDPSHVRHFKSLAEMGERYSPYIDFEIMEKYRNRITKFILTGFRK